MSILLWALLVAVAALEVRILWSYGLWEYVNRGPDHRLGGFIGQHLAAIQTMGSFRSPRPPNRFGWKHVAAFWPPMLGLAIPYRRKGQHRFACLRVGWVRDVNWGDWTPCASVGSIEQKCDPCRVGRTWDCTNRTANPPPHGGYILDVYVSPREQIIPF